MSEPIKTGLWKKESERGGYYSGSVEINGQQYWVSLYKNDRKTEEKHPDLNLQLKPKDARPSQGARQSRAAVNALPEDDFNDPIPW